MTHVRNQDIAVEGELTSNSMRLKLPIDLDDLLRDGRVVWIGKWDPDGTFRGQALLFKGRGSTSTG